MLDIQLQKWIPSTVYGRIIGWLVNETNSSTNEKEDKPYFAKAEDNLIALGLEHFYDGTDRWKNNKAKGLTEAYTYISSKIMRGKTMKQIRLRAKNRKDPARKNEPNAIMHYFQHSKAPRVAMDELKSYDPRQVSNI